MSSALLEAKHLQKAFGGIKAVTGLDLALEDGELRSLIGPNGAGKSTLFALLVGLHQPDSGSIFFEDEDITTLPSFKRVRKGVSLKFQTTRIYRELTVEENLRIPLRAHNGGDLFDHAIEELRILRLMDAIANELSHAEQQWLEICMALSTDPRVLLLDEPTAGMTPQEGRATADAIKSLNQKGLSILVVEHDMGFVRELGGRVTVLHEGRVFRSGTMEAIESDEEVQKIYLGEAESA